MVTLLGLFAEIKRNFIHERTMAGIKQIEKKTIVTTSTLYCEIEKHGLIREADLAVFCFY
jgi:DNA invertase Pin-like site-specific DNA recombinase